MSRKNRLFAKLASTVNNNGKLQETSLAADIDVGGVEGYADTNALPANPALGDLALVTSTNTLYVYNGTAWFNIAIANQAPTAITGNQASYTLATDGTPTVVTLVSIDPEGLPLTWSAAISGDTQVGTLAQADNVFTVTPSTDQADTGTLSVTFSVTDGNNTESSVSSFTLSFLSPLWGQTVLSIGTSSTDSLDNKTYIDRSTNSADHTVGLTGTASRDIHYQSSFNPYLDNWSVDFNNDGYLSIPNSTDFNLDQNVGFTIEFWIKPRAGSTFATVFCYWHYPEGYRFDIAQDGTSMHWYMDTGGNQISFSTTPNEWYHVAIVGDGAGTTTGYLNGVSVGTTTRAYVNVTNGRIFNIGSIQPYGSLSYRHASNLSNFRFVNGSTVYSGNFTPPTEKLTAITNTKLLTCQSNRFIDNSSSARVISLVGTPKISAVNPFGQGSEYAAGENKGSLYRPAATSWKINNLSSGLDLSGDFTIEMWWYPDIAGTPPASQYIMDFGSSPRLSVFWYWNGTQATDYAFYAYTNGYRKFSSNSNQIYPTNSWTHLAFVRTISDSTVRLYANGVFQGAAEVIFSGDPTGNIFNLGNPNGGNSDVPSYWSDVKITPSAKYSSNFTPPTTPLGSADAGFYYPFDNIGIFDKTGNNELTPSDAVTSTAQTKYASSVISIEGNNNRGYIILPSSTSLLNANDIVTIEGWVYLSGDNSGDNPGFFGSGLHSYPNRWVFDLASVGGNIIPRFVGDDNNPLTNGTPIPAPNQQWHHIAVVNNPVDNYFKAYVNGTLSISIAAQSQPFYNGQHEIGAGLGNSAVAGGEYYIENFQILKGVAKYTTDFTPPTGTQGLTYQAES